MMLGFNNEMDDTTLADPYSLDSVPQHLSAAYYWYLQEADSEHTLTGEQWLRWRAIGVGKASDFHRSLQLEGIS